LATNLVML